MLAAGGEQNASAGVFLFGGGGGRATYKSSHQPKLDMTSQLCHAQICDEGVPLRTILSQPYLFRWLALHFYRRSGMASFVMELMRDDRDGT